MHWPPHSETIMLSSGLLLENTSLVINLRDAETHSDPIIRHGAPTCIRPPKQTERDWEVSREERMGGWGGSLAMKSVLD